jgi:hypothetical protein
MVAALKSRQRTPQGEMLGGNYDSRIVRDPSGFVLDGREAFMAKLTAAEYAKSTHSSPDELGKRVWELYIAGGRVVSAKGQQSETTVATEGCAVEGPFDLSRLT